MAGSFVAAAVALLPLLVVALSELYSTPSGVVSTEQVDDASYRGAGLFFAAAPFLYVATVPLCFIAGQTLLALRLSRLFQFLAGAVGGCILLSLLGALAFGVVHASFSDGLGFFVVLATLSVVSALPAAAAYWYLVVQPHNPSLNTDAGDKAARAG